MRTLAILGLTAVLGALAACAPRVVPVPAVETPRFPDFLPPSVPADAVGGRAAQHQDRAWRFLQAGDLTNAEREVEAALQAVPAYYPALTIAGYIGLAREDEERALTYFERSLARQNGDTAALVGRGQALVALNREPEAIATFEAALAVDPSLVDVRRRVAVLRFRALEQDLALAREAAQAGRLDAAEQAYRAALARSPDSAFLYRELADVERRRGQVDLAMEYFRKAIELDPSDAGSLLQIAALLEARDELTQALEVYDRALALDPAPSTEALRDAVRARLELARLPAEYRAIATASQVARGDLAALIGVRLSHVLQALAARETVVLTDMRGDWAEPWIVAVTQAGVMEAYANHTFQPRAPVRRVDLAEAVVRLLPHIAAPTDLRAWQGARRSFTDLSAGHLAYPAASAAVASGVMTMGSGGSFAPSEPVTGAEAMAAIERLEAMAGPPTGRRVPWQ
jgi:type IV pilus assembly protein PilF